MIQRAFSLLLLVLVSPTFSAEAAAKKTPKEALKAFNDLIGDWRATGTPETALEKKQRKFWTESLAWSWQFKGDDAWLVLTVEKGKYFTSGELRYLPDKDLYQLTLKTPAMDTLVFAGGLKDQRLTLDRSDADKGQDQRVVLTLLHENRYLYRHEIKPKDKTGYVRQYQVGATKEGVPFATGDGKPECVVSGGLGTRPVEYKGKTYYVCCSGCLTAFKDNPEKYIKEFEERKANEAKEKKK